MLKYTDCAIGMLEVPKELSLVINISNCPHKCAGCHTPYLQEDRGLFLKEEINNLLDKYENFVSCVCFMGGDHEILQLFSINHECRKRELKTCLYSGSDNKELIEKYKEFDYVKLGPYIAELGGLDSKTTNQRFYVLEGNHYV